jgi:hypothetical protein
MVLFGRQTIYGLFAAPVNGSAQPAVSTGWVASFDGKKIY